VGLGVMVLGFVCGVGGGFVGGFENITITGQSMIGETQAIYMSANISTDGNSNASITTSIMNESVYAANKVECRKDIADFQTAILHLMNLYQSYSLIYSIQLLHLQNLD
jgi:hypothetical protein